MRNLAIVGHLCVDLTPELDAHVALVPGSLSHVGPLAFSLGGCVANTSRTLAGLGHPVTAYAAAGDDELGALIRADLPSELVDLRVRSSTAATSYSLVLEPRGADRAFWHHVGANAALDGSELDVRSVDLLHVGYPSLLPGLIAEDADPLEALLRRARAAGATTSVDLAVVDPASDAAQLDWSRILRRIAPHIDVLTPSLDDLRSILPSHPAEGGDQADYYAELLLSWGVAVVVISDGARGLLLRTAEVDRLAAGGAALRDLSEQWADRVLHMPAITVDVPETTNGAGDASTAGILYGISCGLSPEESMRIATGCAAAAISGCKPSLSTMLDAARDLQRTSAKDGGPLLLPPNQPRGRFYRGGDRIARFRGRDAADPYTPEDWVGSTVTVRGEPDAGLTILPHGRSLRDAVAEDPQFWLGREHVRRFGTDTKMLVKLLDAGQRLPVHAHPGGEFAAHHLGAAHGKAEAWYVLEPGTIHLGLVRDVTPAELAALVERQDSQALLALLHAVSVEAGDRIFVPPGTLHAIGEGVLLVEVQEPEDLSILLEWRDFAIDGVAEGHLGVGFARALEAVDHRALADDELSTLMVRAHQGTGLPRSADAFFRLERIDVDGMRVLQPGFAVLIGLDGAVRLAHGDGLQLERGTTVLVPAATGPLRLSGSGRVLAARPPEAS